MSNAMPTMALSSDPTRRNVLFNTTATVDAAVSAVRFRTIAAIFSTIQLASPDAANVCRIVPSRLYVPLSSDDLAEARELLKRIC